MYDMGVKCLQCGRLLYKGNTIRLAMAGENCCPYCGQRYHRIDLTGGDPGFQVVSIREIKCGFLNLFTKWEEVKDA